MLIADFRYLECFSLSCWIFLIWTSGGSEGEDNYHLLGIIYEGLNRETLSQWYEKIIRPSDSKDYLDRGKSTILRVPQFEVAEPKRDGPSGNRNYRL